MFLWNVAAHVSNSRKFQQKLIRIFSVLFTAFKRAKNILKFIFSIDHLRNSHAETGNKFEDIVVLFYYFHCSACHMSVKKICCECAF